MPKDAKKFAETLAKVRENLPEMKELNLTYQGIDVSTLFRTRTHAALQAAS